MSSVEPFHVEAFHPDFHLIRALGEGSVARVYLARETSLRRLVAIKVLRRDVAMDGRARRRFEREARSAARLIHPYVVSIYRVGQLADGTSYIVMQYLEGRNLEDELAARGPMDEDKVRRILVQVAAGLAEAHSKGIMHRDVRPANVVWMEGANRAVLTDFGIAGILETGSETVTKITRSGELLGRLEYQSPEQLTNEPLTPATDIYSLGILGYELLTGEGPYEVGARLELADAHLHSDPRPLRSLRPELSADLESFLERCLAKTPEQRPGAADVAWHLGRTAGSGGASRGRAGGLTPGIGRALEEFPTIRRFVEELSRRRVFNVGLLYAAAAFVLLQAVDIIVPALPVPEWTHAAIVTVLLAGFPVALVLGWAFDLTGGGIRRAEEVSPERLGWKHRALQITGLGLSLVLASLLGWWILSP